MEIASAAAMKARDEAGDDSTAAAAVGPGAAVDVGGDAAGPEAYEAEHVHAVYEAIAPHFSLTRHKPWPRVAAFLDRQPPGSVGLDVGCGNGKYLSVNPAVHLLGSDRSPALVDLAWVKGQQQQDTANEQQKDVPTATTTTTTTTSRHELCVADGLALPYRPGAADFAICIAVIHHLSTRPRRREALAALLECVRPAGQGRVLVYVWALEQSETSRRRWGEGDDQDTLVPWVMRGPRGHPNAGATYQRYYHLYREGELEEDVVAVGGRVIESGYDQDNWWAVFTRGNGDLVVT